MSYTSATASSPGTRTVDPVGIVDHSGRWYLVAEHRGQMRSYRVSRIAGLTVLASPSRPADTRPLAVIWEELRARMSSGLTPVAVTLLVHRERAGVLRMLLNLQVVDGHSIEVEPAPTPGAAETWRTTVRLPDVMTAVAVLHAPYVTVLEPGWMAAEIRSSAQRALEHYPE